MTANRVAPAVVPANTAVDAADDLAGLIRRAEAARDSLSTALSDVRRLCASLRKRRRADRLVRETLEGLRKLKLNAA